MVVSDQLAERYALHLSASWRQWFDIESDHQRLVGSFRTPINIGDLMETAPPDLWPGFMPPDTLPIVTNDYGDWWCVRVGPQNQIDEIIQWSHAGGDWLPIGRNIAQAALWDHVQHWRTQAIEIQQAAREYPSRGSPDEFTSPVHLQFVQWLASNLGVSVELLNELFRYFEVGQYQRGLELMLAHDWAVCATACELVEMALQGKLARLADPQLARQCGINWTPEYTSWLFDTRHIQPSARQLLLQMAPDVVFDQDWQSAEGWARRVKQRRTDLNWAGDICAWAALRRGDTIEAANQFFDNRHTSAFTDQSVRLRSHWFEDRYGKFSVAQLAQLREHLPDDRQNDPYLQILWNEPSSRTRGAVKEYWLRQAEFARAAGDHAECYRCLHSAGWDLGAERMSDYLEILDGIAQSALNAGWTARALVAQAHAESLKRKLNIR